jgi:hypothetical protein
MFFRRFCSTFWLVACPTTDVWWDCIWPRQTRFHCRRILEIHPHPRALQSDNPRRRVTVLHRILWHQRSQLGWHAGHAIQVRIEYILIFYGY